MQIGNVQFLATKGDYRASGENEKTFWMEG